MKHANEFFAMQRERYRMLLRRRSRAEKYRHRPCPWQNAPRADGSCHCDECLLERDGLLTRDTVLRQWRFCNVFREDDRTTIWFRENIRQPLRDDPKVVLATVAFRWFNRIETGEKIRHLLLGKWDSKEARQILYLQEPVVTGAYMIKTPAGKDKLDGVLWCIDQFATGWSGRMGFLCLQDAWTYLRTFPYLGPFMAYEVVSDLRHTHVLEGVYDIMTWANAGPGCTRGIGRVVCGDPKNFTDSSQSDQRDMNLLMKQLLEMSRSAQNWPAEWPRWEMREVEHGLCEFDKYCRGKVGERLKRRYQ